MKNGSGLVRLAVWTGLIGAILAIPLVAMQLTDDVAWTTFDFVAAGLMLGAAALTYELITMNKTNLTYCAAAAVAVGTALMLLLANAAVGIFGDEDNAANLIILAVLAVGVVGAVIAQLQPRRMAYAMAATAAAQFAIALIALILGWATMREGVLTAGFAGGWAVSAYLFYLAAGTRTRSAL